MSEQDIEDYVTTILLFGKPPAPKVNKPAAVGPKSPGTVGTAGGKKKGRPSKYQIGQVMKIGGRMMRYTGKAPKYWEPVKTGKVGAAAEKHGKKTAKKAEAERRKKIAEPSKKPGTRKAPKKGVEKTPKPGARPGVRTEKEKADIKALKEKGKQILTSGRPGKGTLKLKSLLKISPDEALSHPEAMIDKIEYSIDQVMDKSSGGANNRANAVEELKKGTYTDPRVMRGTTPKYKSNLALDVPDSRKTGEKIIGNMLPASSSSHLKGRLFFVSYEKTKNSVNYYLYWDETVYKITPIVKDDAVEGYDITIKKEKADEVNSDSKEKLLEFLNTSWQDTLNDPSKCELTLFDVDNHFHSQRPEYGAARKIKDLESKATARDAEIADLQHQIEDLQKQRSGESERTEVIRRGLKSVREMQAESAVSMKRAGEFVQDRAAATRVDLSTTLQNTAVDLQAQVESTFKLITEKGNKIQDIISKIGDGDIDPAKGKSKISDLTAKIEKARSDIETAIPRISREMNRKIDDVMGEFEVANRKFVEYNTEVVPKQQEELMGALSKAIKDPTQKFEKALKEAGVKKTPEFELLTRKEREVVKKAVPGKKSEDVAGYMSMATKEATKKWEGQKAEAQKQKKELTASIKDHEGKLKDLNEKSENLRAAIKKWKRQDIPKEDAEANKIRDEKIKKLKAERNVVLTNRNKMKYKIDELKDAKGGISSYTTTAIPTTAGLSKGFESFIEKNLEPTDRQKTMKTLEAEIKKSLGKVPSHEEADEMLGKPEQENIKSGVQDKLAQLNSLRNIEKGIIPEGYKMEGRVVLKDVIKEEKKEEAAAKAKAKVTGKKVRAPKTEARIKLDKEYKKIHGKLPSSAWKDKTVAAKLKEVEEDKGVSRAKTKGNPKYADKSVSDLKDMVEKIRKIKIGSRTDAKIAEMTDIGHEIERRVEIEKGPQKPAKKKPAPKKAKPKKKASPKKKEAGSKSPYTKKGKKK